jgi:hypothetical protein
VFSGESGRWVEWRGTQVREEKGSDGDEHPQDNKLGSMAILDKEMRGI